MIARVAESLVRTRLAHAPAVALVGPRQAGKTTLARSLGAEYFDLEQGGDRLRLDLRWAELGAGSRLVVLDEAQAWPEVFPRLRGAIDADRDRDGRFLLCGSVSPGLMREVSESLAGRLALVELTPFLLPEVGHERLDDLWLRGGYPGGGILEPSAYGPWQRDYLQLLALRDLPTWGLPSRPQTTERLLHMLAAVHGQVLNATQLGQSLGLSHTTVNGYLDYLEGAFLIRLLRPYQANLTKRLVKRPKVYWRDSGLLHSLLRVADVDHLLHQPWVGASWEGFVVEQLISVARLTDPSAAAWYFRTSDGWELDLLLEHGGERWAVEVKLTASPGPDDVRRLNRAADMVAATRRVLICRVPAAIESGDCLVCGLDEAARRLAVG